MKSCATTYKSRLGLVAKNKRVIVPGTFYEQYFPASAHTDPILNKDGSVQDTVELCKQIVLKTLGDTKKIATVLKRPTTKESAEAIFNFLYRHYQYREDKPGVEQLRRPARAWHDRKEGIDCDCFSISISSILTNLSIPHYFRIVKMYGRDYYQHIYVVIPKSKGANLNKRAEYIVIDPVLDKFDYEAPGITEIKDYHMEGIPIQYLNGLGCAPAKVSGLMGFGSEFEGLGWNFYYPNNQRPFYRQPYSAPAVYQDFLRRQKRHLINTRNIIQRNPQKVSQWYRPRILLGMIDELVGAWDNEHTREATLEKLSGMEHHAIVSGLNGLGALGGFFDKLKKLAGKIKDGVVKGAKWVATAAKKVAQVVLKYNPLSIAARLGFRAAMKLNFGYLANRAYWGYFSEAEAKAKNVSSSYWNKAKTLKDKMEHVFVDILKGDADNLRNDIMSGGAKRSAGGNLHGTQGLGIALESAMTTAMAFLVPLVAIAKSIFGGGGGDSSADAGGGAAPDGTQAPGAQSPDGFAPASDGSGYNPGYGPGGGMMPNNGGGGPDNGGADNGGGNPGDGSNNPGGGNSGSLFNFSAGAGGNKKLLLYAALAAGGLLAMKAFSSGNNAPQATTYLPPQPQPLPAPQPAPLAPQPVYQPMAGVKKRRAATKRAVKTIKLT